MFAIDKNSLQIISLYIVFKVLGLPSLTLRAPSLVSFIYSNNHYFSITRICDLTLQIAIFEKSSERLMFYDVMFQDEYTSLIKDYYVFQ